MLARVGRAIGVVLLRGSVKLLEKQRQAGKKVSSGEHVRGVESKIIIDTRRTPDLQLKELVKEQHLGKSTSRSGKLR